MCFGCYLYPNDPHLYPFACCYAYFREKTNWRNSNFRIGNHISPFRYCLISSDKSGYSDSECRNSDLYTHCAWNYFFLFNHKMRFSKKFTWRETQYHYPSRNHSKKRNGSLTTFYGWFTLRIAIKKYLLHLILLYLSPKLLLQQNQVILLLVLLFLVMVFF